MPDRFCFLKAAEYIKKYLIKYIDMYMNCKPLFISFNWILYNCLKIKKLSGIRQLFVNFEFL